MIGDEPLRAEPWQLHYLERAAKALSEGKQIIIGLPRQHGTRLRTTVVRSR